jgi:hypothetical protein
MMRTNSTSTAAPTVFVTDTSAVAFPGMIEHPGGNVAATGEFFAGSQFAPDAAVVVAIPEHRLFVERFIAVQRWEGVVTTVAEYSFIAELRDLKNPAEPIEEAEILRAELSPDDVPLLTPGAVFYWSIGYQDSRFGQRTKQSAIRFRRLPAWAHSDLAAARADAERLGRTLPSVAINGAGEY